MHDLAFDDYCIQHPETYCRSPKSYAAHLTRLYAGLEYPSPPPVYAAIQSWLNGRMILEKPELLSRRGNLTILEVRAAATLEEYRGQVWSWAENEWRAYAPQHEIAHRWIEMALGKSATRQM